jgi:hypothetical protein
MRTFEYTKREKDKTLSPAHFRLVKLFLDGLLPSRAHLRFTLQHKNKFYLLDYKMMLLTINSKY